MDEDFVLALQLQEQFDYEESVAIAKDVNLYDQTSKKRKVESNFGSDVIPFSFSRVQPERPMSIVDDSWELLDPSPDARAMFLEFNDMFFWGKLSGVEVKWSPRMTLCAGVCSYEGRGGLCSIRLSEPLLKLRPRRDLVETLLHEMIHALLFVTQNNRDRDGHGPEFCKHMDRINTTTGTNITVYHTFHDEVDVYRQHWWRCDGPCRERGPYFGYVKRAMNRAPSARDPWWEDHRRSCGGAYAKVKEPEGYGKKGKASTGKASSAGKSRTPSASAGSGLQDIRKMTPFSGKGNVLGGSSQTSSSQKTFNHSPPSDVSDYLVSSKPLPSPLGQKLASRTTLPGLFGPISSDRKGGVSNVKPLKQGAQDPCSKQTVPVKASISNTKAFVNIGGSPVRISRTNGHFVKPFGNTSESTKTHQNLIKALFQTKGLASPEKTASSSSESKPVNETKKPFTSVKSGTPSQGLLNFKNLGRPSQNGSSANVAPSAVPGGSSSQPNPSERLGCPETANANVPASRKRAWEGRPSAHIFDFFNKTTSASSPSRAEKEGEVATATPPPAAVASVTVSCPVCQLKVPPPEINEHLDSCLK